MIIDSLENITFYNNIPQNVIEFIENLTPKIEVGRYEIDKNSYANVEVYYYKK